LAAQIIAIIIFVLMFIAIAIDKIEKYIISLGCGALTIAFVFGACMKSGDAIVETLAVKEIFTAGFWFGETESSCGINWATIIFLFGMMVMVEKMTRVGLFRWMCLGIAKLVKYKVIPIFISFITLSFVLAMFIDSITVILFLAAVTVELSIFLKFDPIPMVLAEIFCANLGGSATMSGDPPNILIGTSLHLSFIDFLGNTGWIAVICLAFTIIYFLIIFGRKYSKTEHVSKEDLPNIKDAILDKSGFIVSWIIFLIAIALLITHSITKLSVASIGLIIAFLSIITSPRNVKNILGDVDYKTILFLIGLFIVVGGLEQTGVLELIAGSIASIANGNIYMILALIIFLSAICSAFIDNIPFAAAMIPVIKSLALTQGIAIESLAWTLAMGTDIGGSATPIGASANVVGLSKVKEHGFKVGWGKYCLVMAPITIIIIVISLALILFRYL